MKNYATLTEVRLTHEYYASAGCPALLFEPTTETADLMKRYNILFRSLNNRYCLLIESGIDLKKRFEYIEQITNSNTLDFELNLVDPEFYMFTDLPLNWNGTLNFSSKNIKNNQLIPTFSNEAKKSVGVVKIYFSDLISTSGPLYSIDFLSRRTIWNYYVVNRNEMNLDGLAVQTSGKITFNGPRNSALPNAEKALGFASNEEIPLTETSEVKYDLVKKSEHASDGRGRTIFKGLPLASPKNTTINTNDGESKFFSSIYIYI